MKTNKMLAMLTLAVVLGGIVLYLESIPVQARIEGGENGWGTEYIMPLPETNFQAIGNWEIYPAGSADISDPGQGYIDGEGNEACLIAESSASYVDIWRYIEWEDRLVYADGTKLTLSVYAALYDSTYQGQIQLGVIWYYHFGQDILTESDFSERVDLVTEWLRIPFIADFTSAQESMLYKVKLIIRVRPDGLTKAKIDRFRLCVTEGQSALLSHERRFQSNLMLESITQDNQEVNTAMLSLSCGIDTGDDWYCGGVIYKRHIIDYINFTVRTPYEGTKMTDSLDINAPSMFSADGSFDDFAALWETVVTINKEWEVNRNILETTATYALGFFPFGGHISATLSYARAGENLRTLGEGGIVYPHGTGSMSGRELTCWQEVNALDEMGVQGSLHLRDIIASVPIDYKWKGDPNIDIVLEIEVTIGWEEAFYSSELGENTLFLSPNPSETTHTYTVNLKKGDPLYEWDTDEDGLSDENEKSPDVYNCTTDHTNPDSDYDGLSDKEEILDELTLPNDPDTDDDGLNDGYEVNTLGTSPLSDDTDDDGLTDGDELYIYYTDPLNPDTDNDRDLDGVDIDPLDPLVFNQYTPATYSNNPPRTLLNPGKYLAGYYIDTPYGKGYHIDTIGTGDDDYFFLAYQRDLIVADSNGKIHGSGYFRMDDTLDQFNPSYRRFLKAFALSDSPTDNYEMKGEVYVLLHDWGHTVETWYEREFTISGLTPGESYRLAFGRAEWWTGFYQLEAEWAHIRIQEYTKATYCNPTPRTLLNPGKYINGYTLDTPYGIGYHIDTIGSSDTSYFFLAYHHKLVVADANGQISGSGYFRMHDTLDQFNPSYRRFLKAFALSDSPTDNYEMKGETYVLLHDWGDTIDTWYYRGFIINGLTPGQTYRLAFGRADWWPYDYQLTAEWARVTINGYTPVTYSNNPPRTLLTPGKYINSYAFKSPYGIGYHIDTIGTGDDDYFFLAYHHERVVANENGEIRGRGYFRMDDTLHQFNPSYRRFLKAFALSDSPTDNYEMKGEVYVLLHDWGHTVETWYEREFTISGLTPGESYRLAFGRAEWWTGSYQLEAEWSEITIYYP